MFKYDVCRCCGNEDIKSFISLPDSPVANALFEQPNYNRYPLDLNYCDVCGHLQLDSAPDPDVVFESYRYRSGVSNSFKLHFQNYAQTIFTNYNLNQDSSILEIGSNDGYLLNQFKTLGCKVQGVEPSKYLADYYKEFDIPLHSGFFTTDIVSRNKWQETYDVVCANNVLAHIPDTHDVIQGIADSLKENGLLIVECGHRDAILSGSYLDNVYHEHIDYYSPHSFGTLIEQYSLIVEHVELIESHGLSFRLIARKSKKDSMTSFESINLDEMRTKVKDIINSRKEKLESLIHQRPFVAYGAAAKAVTSLYSLDLVNERLVGVYDDNELKQGFYFPGTDILIEHPSKIDKNSLVVVTAWNFFDEIKNKLIANGHKGDIICML
ncbi:MAG: methyltransferase domain-containing protein [Proteobacteria bacterium]|nr:methyltransferase domain-containing protein [Pseudomonadota bacterium]NBP14542.1 methyltransferase domain-containing protein [bacterium]